MDIPIMFLIILREYLIVRSRSCPFNCDFRYHPLGQKYRQRDY